ncbi:hypothetical protein F2P81_016321 [Scophthalmus maximus]|uniref:Uncharacterized protein n=1 Tax=Scophthalmus maximus TaxID=52904 RepID=A0A6A4S985_SCOMX|nr:hypothetical protein F2P81_016321 [Scophthalmus maximus]
MANRKAQERLSTLHDPQQQELLYQTTVKSTRTGIAQRPAATVSICTRGYGHCGEGKRERRRLVCTSNTATHHIHSIPVAAAKTVIALRVHSQYKLTFSHSTRASDIFVRDSVGSLLTVKYIEKRAAATCDSRWISKAVWYRPYMRLGGELQWKGRHQRLLCSVNTKSYFDPK